MIDVIINTIFILTSLALLSVLTHSFKGGGGGRIGGGGGSVKMLTKDRVFVVNAGEEIKLECEFLSDYFNLFDNPILWRKVQLNEETQVNMMGNLMEPFESAKRFRVTFVQRPSRYTLGLIIQETYQEDSGNYSCEVNGPQNTLLGLVTHHIFVRAPIESISVSGGALPLMEEESTTAERSLVFIEGGQAVLECRARGGYPPPDVTIQIGNRDITNRLTLSHSVQMSGVRSLRVMHYTTARSVRNFSSRAADDGQTVRCAVTVAGLMSNITFARLQVHYAPIVRCHSKYASVGEKNAYVSCEIRSKPEVAAMFWIIDANGTTLAEGEVINEYWSSVMFRSDGVLEMQLFLRETKLESFRKYTMVAENSVGVRTDEVYLLQRVIVASPKLDDYTPKMVPQAIKDVHGGIDGPTITRLPNGETPLRRGVNGGTGKTGLSSTGHLVNGIDSTNLSSSSSRGCVGIMYFIFFFFFFFFASTCLTNYSSSAGAAAAALWTGSLF